MSTSTTKSIPTWGEVTGKLPTVYKETRTGYYQRGSLYVDNVVFDTPSIIVWTCTPGNIQMACDTICLASEGEYGFIKLSITINNISGQVFVMDTTILGSFGTFSLIGKFDYQPIFGGNSLLDVSINANAVLFS